MKQSERKRQMQERLDVTLSGPCRPAEHNTDRSVRAEQSAPSLSASADESTAMDIRSASTASRRSQGGVPLPGFDPSLERDLSGWQCLFHESSRRTMERAVRNERLERCCFSRSPWLHVSRTPRIALAR